MTDLGPLFERDFRPKLEIPFFYDSTKIIREKYVINWLQKIPEFRLYIKKMAELCLLEWPAYN